MAKVEFNYKDKIIVIQCLEDEKMEEIIQKFCTKVEMDINNVCFSYSGNKINSQLTFNQIINDSDKERKTISVSVDYINQENLIINSKIIKSIFPICPECKEKVPLEIDDYKINYSCKNGHSINFI